MLVSKHYDLKWQINFATHYQFSACKKLFNIKTKREIKKIVNGGSIGYCIDSKFYSLTFLKNHIEKLPLKPFLPF